MGPRIVDLGSLWGEYEYVTNVGYAAWWVRLGVPARDDGTR